MSSWSCASSVTTQWTPQTTARRRPVEILGDSATIGERGRSRATRRPVEPDDVQQTTAARSSVSAIWRAASAIASAPVASGAARCASIIVPIERVAFDLLGDTVHRRHRLHRDSCPAALSADSITASAPSKTAVATSETSARVGTGAVIIDSSICVATTTGFPATRRRAGHLLLNAGHLFERHFHAKIAARHHQRIGQAR